jgi:transcriptional regulator with XRE-family HTH domain
MKLKNEVEKAPWNIKLIIARMLLNLTQKEAADKIGTSQKMVWIWESGKVMPRERSRRAIASAYGVNYEELFEGLIPKIQ